MTEVGLLRAGRNDKVVVDDNQARSQGDTVFFDIDTLDLIHDDLGSACVLQKRANGGGDLGRSQRCQRHLIKQRLEYIAVTPVNYDNVYRRTHQLLGAVHPSETGTKNHHPRPSTVVQGDAWQFVPEGHGCHEFAPHSMPV